MKHISPSRRARAAHTTSLLSSFKNQSHHDTATFHEMIKLLTALRRSGYIQDESFSTLVSYVAANFIETELNHKISQVFDTKLNSARLMKYLDHV